ncbi:tRNA-modifying protein YgfZ [Thalassotalea sediminis]|uniref:tRNA-modifying protein YgfZ n=1 Tax=Thalassotalea sediminis TaxID=1759089 RepID=UPI0025730FC4|nr:tRNA-modifying protein YgfZ [Thalassotalea sediminis]
MKPSLTALPHTFTIPLTQVQAISLSGEEQVKYLQGQVTCDVETLPNAKLLYGAHCTAKGKVLSCFRLFEHQQSLLLLQPAETLASSLKELQKFGVFAKVTIEKSPLSFTAVCGQKATDSLAKHCTSLPDESCPVVSNDQLSILYIASKSPRYIVAGKSDDVSALILALDLPAVSSEVWSLLEITNGIPLLKNTEQEYVPQMLNMQAINGISFTKGCYLGQETVARMQYLGRNKKAMFTLKGEVHEQPEHIAIEKQLGENWRKAGDVISHYTADTGELYVQAILASDTEEQTNLRLKSPQACVLSLMALPYTLENQ